MTKKRISCPDCNKMILAGSKKCRFCKARLNGSDTKEDYLKDSPKVKNSKLEGAVTLIPLAVIVTILILLSSSLSNRPKTGNPAQQALPVQQTTPPTTLTPTPNFVNTTTKKTTTNQINCTGPDGKTFKTTQKECDALNSAWGKTPPPDKNVIVKCNIHPNCGGGYREMSQSSCEQMTCCRVPDGSYSFISKSRCTEMYNDAETTLKNKSQEWIDSWNKQDQPNSVTPTNISQEQKQRCLKEAEALYYSNLRTCTDYYSEQIKRDCETKYYQQYIRDKGACN